MKDGTKVSIIYALSFIPMVISIFWISSFIRHVYYYPSDLVLPFVALFFSILFVFFLSRFEPRTKHWRKANSEFEDNYVYEKEAE